MHGVIGADRSTVPVVVCIQGGGALGAFPVGAAIELISNPYIKLMGATGTSSGAVTARALVNGYVHGLQQGGIAEARAMAAGNMLNTWEQMIRFQSKKLPLWYTTADFYFAHLPADIRRSFHETAYNVAGHRRDEAPLLEFYRFAQQNSCDLSPQLTGEHPFLKVNVTRSEKGKSIWHATPADETVITLNGLSAEQQHRAVAASGCLDFSLPVDVFNDGTLFHDGAYSSPFPDPHGTAALCQEKGYAMVILRTRPLNSFTTEQNPEHGTDGRPSAEDGKRAHFNSKLDRLIPELRAAYPRLRLVVIEPESVEPHATHNILSNEMRFDRARISERIENGQRAAIKAIENDLQLPAMKKLAPSPQADTAFKHPVIETWKALADLSLLPMRIMFEQLQGRSLEPALAAPRRYG